MRLRRLAIVLTASTLVSSASQGATQTVSGDSKRPPIVTAIEAPTGTEILPVTWLSVAVPDLGVMRAAVARPPGTGPFPVVLVLHGTHGFAREYVEWASALTRGGFMAVAACWFSGGGGAGLKDVTPPIPCPELPPLGSGEYANAVQIVDALVHAARALPGARSDRLAVIGHSRGAGATQQYLLAGGNIQAAILHSSGYALRPWTRAAEVAVPLLIMHGTADRFGENTAFALAREFEMSLRAHKKSVETAYCEGCGHSTFFTSSSQRDNELKRMIEFLRHHLGGS
jgi:alpha-beta hydrolase superfamily lysophospholipase